MSNAPVYYALVQAQFNPVAAMAKYVNEVQELLRHKGYTLFETQQVTQLQFVQVEGQPPVEPTIAATTSWLITKSDRTAGFILNASSLIFHTTHYETSEEFIPVLLDGLRAVHEVVELDHISRLGVRYLNAVLPSEQESVDDYLVSGLHGINFGATQRYSLNESVFETECTPLLSTGTMIARVYRANTPLGFPPDMVPNGLVKMSRFETYDTLQHAVIDTDHFVEGLMPLEFSKIGEQLLSLHATMRRAFEATITDHAKTMWS